MSHSNRFHRSLSSGGDAEARPGAGRRGDRKREEGGGDAGAGPASTRHSCSARARESACVGRESLPRSLGDFRVD